MNNRRPRKVEHYRVEEIEGEYLLYSVNETRGIYLNNTAALILNACNGELTVAEIIAALSEAYPDAKDTMASDVNSVLKQFVDHGAIELV